VQLASEKTEKALEGIEVSVKDVGEVTVVGTLMPKASARIGRHEKVSVWVGPREVRTSWSGATVKVKGWVAGVTPAAEAVSTPLSGVAPPTRATVKSRVLLVGPIVGKISGVKHPGGIENVAPFVEVTETESGTSGVTGEPLVLWS
jgi:hypothetical protein